MTTNELVRLTAIPKGALAMILQNSGGAPRPVPKAKHRQPTGEKVYLFTECKAYFGPALRDEWDVRAEADFLKARRKKPVDKTPIVNPASRKPAA